MENTNDDFELEKPVYTRKGARDEAFKLIFQAKEQGTDLLEMIDEAVSKPYKGKDSSYLRAIVSGVVSEMENLDNLIEEKSKAWKKERISKVCISILRLAFYEILYMEDIPQSVSINEAVDLAKKYEGPEAGSFVNGILGSSNTDTPVEETPQDEE